MRKMSLTPAQMLKRGGAWLAVMREWVHWHAWNGSTVKLGSEQHVHLVTVSMRDLEKLAAEIAIKAIEEGKK